MPPDRSLMSCRLPLALLALALVAPAAAQTTEPLLRVRRTDGAIAGDLLRVDGSGSALFGGDFFGGGQVPAEGPGTRMLWSPPRAAFRAGDVRAGVSRFEDLTIETTTGAEWNSANVGLYSVAVGNSTQASGEAAVAAGSAAYALGPGSIATGNGTTATGVASVAMGFRAHTNGFRLFTSSDLSTGVTFQRGNAVSNWGQSSAVISTSTGAYLSTGGVWTNASDRNRKRDFRPVDADGVLFASIQALDARTRGLDALPGRLDQMEAELAALRAGRARRPLNAALPALGLLAAGGLVGFGLRRRPRHPSVRP